MKEKINKEMLEEEVKANIEKQKQIQNKQLKKMFIICGSIIIVFLLGFGFVESVRHFEYKSIEFNVVKDGKLIFYNAVFPVYSSITGKITADTYNLYFRKDPRKLENIPFDGEIDLDIILNNMVLKNEYEENCEGDFNIAIANFIQSFKLMNIEVVKDDTAECDAQGRYMYVKIRGGDESYIEQFGPSCYRLVVNNCEILEVTEKFIVEALSEFDKKVYI